MDCTEMVIVSSDNRGSVHGTDSGEVLTNTEGVDVATKLGRNMA